MLRIGNILDRCFDIINGFFWRLEKRIDIWLRINTYEFKEGKVIKNIGRWRTQEISIDEIEQWEIIHEMGFDIVVLRTKDGTITQWLDRYDDLIGILNHNLGTLQRRP